MQAQYDTLLGKEAEEVTAYLNKALLIIESDPYPQSNEITDFIRDKAGDEDGRYSWHAIHNMAELSPEFNKFVVDVEEAALLWGTE
jgi:hypothetical protein